MIPFAEDCYILNPCVEEPPYSVSCYGGSPYIDSFCGGLLNADSFCGGASTHGFPCVGDSYIVIPVVEGPTHIDSLWWRIATH